MIPEAVLAYSRERGIPVHDSARTFMQVVVLRHVSVPGARLMGGAALVHGYSSPRFSEDVDLTQVPDPGKLGPGIARARGEIRDWFAAPVTVRPPAASGRTWRLTVQLGRSESLRLHIDSQDRPSLTSRPLVIVYPSIPPFVVEGVDLDELMSEKVVALASRRYLSGRDMFDLWFHWLRTGSWEERAPAIMALAGRKLESRKLTFERLRSRLASRLGPGASLDRAREEWRRYLPAGFQKPSVFDDIVARCGGIVRLVP